MIKCEVIKDFTLEKFDELKNIKRATSKNDYRKLYKKDIFECNKDMAEYLTGDNKDKQVVVKIIEVIPDVVPEIIIDEEKIVKKVFEEQKPNKKKKSSKK